MGFKFVRCLSIVALTCIFAQSPARAIDANGQIRTFAGGYTGDGGAAKYASLFYPNGVAFDSAGNIYIADTQNNRIRKVDTNGTITTVAGNGTQGYSGDGGQATSAQLDVPSGVAVDTATNVYIVDPDNNVIRKVATDGTITTFAGNGTSGYSGDSGQATSAQLYLPQGVAVDTAGNVYIADTFNNVIRKVATDGTITTVAGNGTGGYSGDGGQATSAQLALPQGVAVDSSGNLYIADTNSSVIRKVATDGTITTVAGDGTSGYSGDGGQATSAQLDYPTRVAADASGNLYIADYYENVVRMVATDGKISTVAGTGMEGYSGDGGQATSAQLNGPIGVAVDSSGNLAIVDSANQVIREVATDGTITTAAGNVSKYSGDAGPATNAQLNNPYGVAVDTAANVYIADSYNNVIRRVATDGTITTLAGDSTSGYSGDSGPATSAQLDGPGNVAVDAAGNVYIADANNNVIRKVATNGTITTVAGDGTAGYSGDGGPATSAQLNHPEGIAFDSAGNLYIADDNNAVIREVTTGGTITTVAGDGTFGYSGDSGPATSAALAFPSDVALDASNNLYISDAFDSVVRKVDTNGTITTVAGDGTFGYSGDGGQATSAQFTGPNALAFDSAGNLYIADSGNNVIRKVATDGTITTVAGDGTQGYSGDGGAATSAQLNSPNGVAVDASGTLYIGDTNNNRVRMVLPNEIFSGGFESP